MKKKPKATVAKADPIAPLVEQVRTLVQSARRAVAGAVNTLQVFTNFEIGRLTFEHEQQGQNRASYGKEMLKRLAASLTDEFGRGYSETNLKLMRQFYVTWADQFSRISQAPSGKSLAGPIGQTLSDQLDSIRQKPSGKLTLAPIGQTLSDESSPISATPSRKSPGHLVPIAQTLSGQFTLSWSHYVVLMSIEDPSERSFYEIESAQSGWSLRDLKRQVASCLYERLALSRDKKGVRKLAEQGHTISEPADLFKSPLVLEFLGLDARPSYSECDLETALIDKLQHFLLEFGKGFLFEARQKRFTFDEDDYFVDLVCYNRLLRCYVLFDLKLDRLSHQDLGQMQMYVNYYDREVKTPDENPTVVILLCKRKKDALIELTLPKDAKIYASQYQLYLPSRADLRKRLMQWTAEEEATR